MLKALYNEARLRLDITTLGPLLIKTSYATVIGADMAPVTTYRNGVKEVFLPGSSLKGIFRSHIEKIINSIQPQVACNPFQRRGDPGDGLYRSFCGTHFENKDPASTIYKGSCPVCRLFGSTEYAGRLAVQDAYLAEDEQKDRLQPLIEHRDGVAIDRLTGGARPGAKFDLDAVTANTTFTTTLHLRNFEIWQLGLLFVIFQDMEEELVRIGSGRSRGLGQVTAHINKNPQKGEGHPGGVVLSTTRTGPTSREPVDELWGVGRWFGSESASYGLKSDDRLTLAAPMPHTTRGIRNVRTFKGEALASLQDQCIDNFVTRMSEWEPENVGARQGR